MTVRGDGEVLFEPLDPLATPARARAVGWLAADAPFPTGAPDWGVILRLLPLVWRCRARQTRGYQPCPLCTPGGGDVSAPDRFLVFAAPTRGSLVLGSAEIWLPDPETGDLWAAPDLVVHYMAAHGYRPPEAFVRSVCAFGGGQAWDAAAAAAAYAWR